MKPATGRFSRQTRFAPIGHQGQARLAQASVAVVGVGALGSHAAETLCRAGVGKLVLVDRDVVEFSNLQRQCLFDEKDARSGLPKADAAVARLREIHSGGQFVAIVEDLSVASLAALPDVDLVIDGCDNFPTRMLLNDVALARRVPWIHGAAIGASGRAMVFMPDGSTPCLRCLLPNPPPTAEVGTCETEGILAAAIAQVAAFQSAQALRILVGHDHDEPPARGMFVCDVWKGEFAMRLEHATSDPACPSCGTRDLPALHEATSAPDSVALCGRDAVQVQPRGDALALRGIDLDSVADRLGDWVEDVERSPNMLRFSAETCRFSLFRGGRALLTGTRDLRRARVLYDRYVGL